MRIPSNTKIQQIADRLVRTTYRNHSLFSVASGEQCDEGEEIIAAHFITGHRIRWNGQYWIDYG